MKKSLFILAVFGLVVSLGVLSADTALTGIVGDYINVSITTTLDFGSIAYGTDVTDSGTDVIIDATGSDTSSGNVNVDATISGTDSTFFSSLLEFEEDGTTTWTDLVSMGTIIVAEGTSITYHTQLNGDTTLYGAGSKTATIVYTITG